MELFFLALLILLMVAALTSGFPVAFALPGSAIIAIGLAALSGYLFAGDPSAYFAQDGPVEWLSAGVTNFRSLYWDVERDTLIAIPLFVFMGIMLQRSKIAEDLLVTMAQLFGPIPGGLGISVVFVGALLAATTGIVGATVIAMGLISLPAMLRNNYSKPLATGTICASGTLGQIIPPSIVLIILADQLSSAADQASTARKAEYKEATGEFSMPSELDITSASAGDMFMGAFLPGLVLVGLYMAYILVTALLRPNTAPPVAYEGSYDQKFLLRVVLALVPPLTLIMIVLGSIIMGVATVNQAGAIGAVGATIMAGYRLKAGERGAYIPAILAVLSILVLIVVLFFVELNIKSINTRFEAVGIVIAAFAVLGLFCAIVWSGWRAYTVEETLRNVMLETAKTTSMVFIILIGAAMLTSAFRGFGGEELVKEFLTSLPGGFWTQFIVVMVVIFLLGFFLDFIEIAVVVVPIVAPILLADPAANITAVWLGVMVGLNIQTSFLTPPFGFALFYLRGVAPPQVKTLQIYRGAVAFIALQLIGLGIAGAFPSLVNYLPYRTYLTSETAPPPMNPRLQQCMQTYVFQRYDDQGVQLRSRMDEFESLDTGYMPDSVRQDLVISLDKARATFELVAAVRKSEARLQAYEQEYRPLHKRARAIQAEERLIQSKIEELEQELSRANRAEQVAPEVLAQIKAQIEAAQADAHALSASMPETWEAARQRYTELSKAAKQAVLSYRQNVDAAYETIADLRAVLLATDALSSMNEVLTDLLLVVDEAPDEAMRAIKQVEKQLGEIAGSRPIVSVLAKARRALKGAQPDRVKALDLLQQAEESLTEELRWRQRATLEFLPGLQIYDTAISSSIGLRLQSRLTTSQAKQIAKCQSVHRDVSLQF